jgi:hypothetical protein
MGVKDIHRSTHQIHGLLNDLTAPLRFTPSVFSQAQIFVFRSCEQICEWFPGDRGGRHVSNKIAGSGEIARQPVSRVLSASCEVGRPFLWDASCDTPPATNPGGGTRTSLSPVAGQAALDDHSRPYSVLHPVGFTLPPLLPRARCALAAPFRPCPRDRPAHACRSCAGGLFSVALSLGSPPPAVSRHRIPVEPGLSSANASPRAAAVQPSGEGTCAPCRLIQSSIPSAEPDIRGGE